jgi:hypothetical protein
MSQALPTGTGPLELGAAPPGKPRHMPTSASRTSSPPYWRSLNTSFCMSCRVKPAGPRWSVPSTRAWVMINPMRVRSVRAVFSSPTILGKPVSG